VSQSKLTPSPLVISPSSPPSAENIESPECEDDISDPWWKSISPGKILIASVIAFGCFLALRALATATPWPKKSQIETSITNDIIRTPSSSPDYSFKTQTKEWEISPLELWDHSLLVTSVSPPSEWTDVSIDGRAEIVVSDITGVWGDVEPEVLGAIQFGNTAASGYAVGAPDSWRPENFAFLTMLTSSPSVQDAIKRIRPGDQCRIIGVKVNCYLKEPTGTKLPLAPSEEGAYPPVTIKVEELIFLRKHNHGWRLASQIMLWVAAALFAAAAAAQMLPDEG
jgi:hypothetical protein